MKNIIIIPTFERPEFLWTCLEQLAKCHEIENKEIWICEDIHVDKPKSSELQDEISETVLYAKTLFSNLKHFRTEHSHHGSSYNVLESFKRACQTDAESIFFIEDDCWVTPDWLRWCQAAHEQFNPFATCGNTAPGSPTSDPRNTAISDTWFQTFALSFHRNQLEAALLPNYADYNLTPTFEWDAYFMKYIFDTSKYAASSCVPRVYHYGFFGYHRSGSRSDGDLHTRIDFIKRGAYDPRLLPPVWDFKPFPKQPLIWNQLVKYGWKTKPKKIVIPDFLKRNTT